MRRLAALLIPALLPAAFVACNGGSTADPPKPTPTAAPTTKPTPAQPTTGTAPVDVASTSTGSVRGKVRIAWTVESSEGTYGFNVYRGPATTGPWTLVNESPVLAAEGGTTNIPRDYEVHDEDESLRLGDVYWYYLEKIDVNGAKRRAWWPPTSVTVSVRYDQQHPPRP